MVTWVIIILVVIWLIGFLGADIIPRFPKTGGWINIIIVIAILLFVLRMMHII